MRRHCAEGLRVGSCTGVIVTNPPTVGVGMTDRLPARVRIGDRESLDSFLERLADANDQSPPELLRRLTAPDEFGSPSAAFLMIKPDPLMVGRIASVSGVDDEAVRRATLLRFGAGLPFRFDGLDPRQRHTFRQVVVQGWFPTFGTQICPLCLGADGIWALHWRLPIVAVCPEHRVFLVTECAGCGGRFRTHRHAPLRPFVGREQPCGNPIGLRNPCRHSAISHRPEPCPAAVFNTAQAILGALAGRPVAMLGALTDPGTYLAEMRHLATLLLHILSKPQGPRWAAWAEILHVDAALRTTSLRGPRWGISPPQSSHVRGHALAEADAILGTTSLEQAATALVPWLDCIAEEPNGPSAWLINRTTRTATMEHLIRAATARRHHVGRRLNTIRGNTALRPYSVPQMMDADVYRDVFAAMLGGYERTGRLYASLCVLRAVAPVASWAEAATAIGLEPEFGVRAARTASLRMRVSPSVFADAVRRATFLLPATRNFRRREARVRALAHDPSTWFDRWRTSMSPARRPTSLPYAVTWMWCEAAQGLFDTSPAWTDPPTRARTATYHAFRNSIPPAAQHDLRSLVVKP